MNHPLQNPDQFSEDLVGLIFQGANLFRRFPAEEDLLYYENAYPELRPMIWETRSACIRIAQSLLETGQQPSDTIPKLNYKDPDEILELYNEIVDITDDKLSYVDTFLDNQFVENPKQIQMKKVDTGKNLYHMYQANIQRPQLSFEPIDNSLNTPFIPKITYKPNAKIPLEKVWESFHRSLNAAGTMDAHLSNLGVQQNKLICYPNPYEYEISTYEFLDRQLQPRRETVYRPIDGFPYTWVNTKAQLQLLSDKLNRQLEFAVDLEQHAYRSYQGFVCLMQISTRDEDFLVDTLVLRSEMQLLNESFTNPNIIKVFHGSDNDILWLQRDFGLYVVNLFDTGQASRVLCYPKVSLAALFERFCNFFPKDKKRLQLSDWRIRPIPEDMIRYAQSDTHFLLYIYDRLHNELLNAGNANKNLLLACLEQSRQLCKAVYTKPLPPTAENFLAKKPVSLLPLQMKVLDSLLLWRDRICREEDESFAFVLPNYMLMKIVELLPGDTNQLFACCSPQPTPFLKANTHQILELIRDARENKAPRQFTSHFSIQTESTNISRPQPLSVPSMAYDDREISSDDLFRQADWFPAGDHQGLRRTADFHPLNQTAQSSFTPFATSSGWFFSPTKPMEKSLENQKKIEVVNASIQSSFSLGPSLSSMVPESMEEIFQLSNANRKRNKEKKKLKEESINAGPISPIHNEELDPDAVVVSPLDPRRTNPTEFMKQIGWLDPNKPLPVIDNSEEETSSLPSASKKEPVSEPQALITKPRKKPAVPQASVGDSGAPKANQNKPQPKPKNNVPYNYSQHDTKVPAYASQTHKHQQHQEVEAINVPDFGRPSRNRRGGKGGRSQVFQRSNQPSNNSRGRYNN